MGKIIRCIIALFCAIGFIGELWFVMFEPDNWTPVHCVFFCWFLIASAIILGKFLFMALEGIKKDMDMCDGLIGG